MWRERECGEFKGTSVNSQCANAYHTSAARGMCFQFQRIKAMAVALGQPAGSPVAGAVRGLTCKPM